MRPLIALAAALQGRADTHTGYACPESFYGDDCRARLASSGCLDGGLTATGSADAGPERLCCAWFECTKNPFPM